MKSKMKDQVNALRTYHRHREEEKAKTHDVKLNPFAKNKRKPFLQTNFFDEDHDNQDPYKVQNKEEGEIRRRG